MVLSAEMLLTKLDLIKSAQSKINVCKACSLLMAYTRHVIGLLRNLVAEEKGSYYKLNQIWLVDTVNVGEGYFVISWSSLLFAAIPATHYNSTNYEGNCNSPNGTTNDSPTFVAWS